MYLEQAMWWVWLFHDVGILTSYEQWLEKKWHQTGRIFLKQDLRTEHVLDAEIEVSYGTDREI